MQANAQSADDDDRMDNHTGGKSVIYQRLSTFVEYLTLVPQSRRWLEIRLGEIRIPPDDQLFFVAYPQRIRLLAVVDNDSPDTVAVLPVLVHVVAHAPRLDLRVVQEPEAAALLAKLTDDPQAGAFLAEAELPRLLAFDDQWQIQGQWGPHPREIETYLARRKTTPPEMNIAPQPSAEQVEQLTQEMRLWYNSGLNLRCVAELRTFLAAMQPAESGADDANDMDAT